MQSSHKLGILLTLIVQSMPSIKALGPKYLWGRVWDPVQDIYGAWPFLLGTGPCPSGSSLISIPFSIAVAIFLGEYYPKGWLPNLLKNTVELIAAVPSVIYGFWGLAVLVPIVRNFETHIGVEPVGVGIFSSSLILAVMIIPYAASLGRSMIQMVPSPLKEARIRAGSHALGSDPQRRPSVYARSGLFAGVFAVVGPRFGRDHGGHHGDREYERPSQEHFQASGNTMASVIANEFTEADKAVYLSALIELGLVLFLVTVVINMIGKKIIDRFTNE